MKGMTFNIQKFSIHDGPGIRTTVFFKGCPLRCRWCANPESQLFKKQLLHDASKCVGCQRCVQVCPRQALTFQEGKIIQDVSACIGCLRCKEACLQEAITFEGDEKQVEEIVKVCLQDLPFYEESGGGVTISGGEGMGQPDFCEALVQQLHAHGIHTAIETTGYIQPEIFQRLARQFDLLLFDVKHYDSAVHKQGTGVNNERILENLAWAASQGIEVLPRIPVIPGFNDSLQDAAGLAQAIKTAGLSRVQLLPFHQFGQNKYHLLHKPYEYESTPALHPEDLEDYKKVFEEAGLECWF